MVKMMMKRVARGKVGPRESEVGRRERETRTAMLM